jgi:hypothetical protein
MLHDSSSCNLPEGPWNPGIQSTLTRELQALATIFRPENVFNDLAKAIELRDTTGIELEELAIFRPERLAVHEVLIRVAADYEIPDPQEAAERSLGITFRRMVQTILARVLPPCQSQLADSYANLKNALAGHVEAELSLLLAESRPTSDTSRGFWQRLRGSGAGQSPPSRAPDLDPDQHILRMWRARAESTQSPLQAAACRALVKVASAVHAKHGRIPRQAAFIGALATELACNDHGGEAIGRLIAPAIDTVAEQEGFRKLPAQAEPVLMVNKGASASGKSTMRPLQRMLAAKTGLLWSDFALISPDIWRRILLDYDSLGSQHRYAGMLTSQELVIIDEKLHRYLMQKGEQGLLSHLWVDRFRFSDTEDSRRLLIRFGKVLCYVFMITPPHETVERAWLRGLEIGRHKAVDDLLAHNIEAFTGMQNILFARALTPDPGLHYEFLDNDVPRGTRPLTVAFGRGGEMNVLDVRRMLDMCRYRKIHIEARNVDEVYPDAAIMSPETNIDFLSNCVRRFPRLNFADRDTGRIYARFAEGRLQWTEPETLARAAADPETEAALRVVAAGLFTWPDSREKRASEFLLKDQFLTIGHWESWLP